MKPVKPYMSNWRNIMMDYNEILNIPPYSLDRAEKRRLLNERLIALSKTHYGACKSYKSMVDALGCNLGQVIDYNDLPFLPVSLFKELDLLSVEKAEVFKTMTSSGTTGQAVSKIYLDRVTAANQQKTLVKIVSNFTGSARMPMLIIDSPSVIKDRAMFSARGAGILGFSIFGSDKAYVLNDDMKIDIKGIEAFLDKHQGKTILLFGFTFMVWQHFYKGLFEYYHAKGVKLDLSRGILIHGGGWKKLASEAVLSEEFKRRLNDVCGIDKVHDYYGMVEQTGCIYMECEYGHLHASIFSDVITRRIIDFKPCEIGEAGIIQVVSLLPESYPGHSLLTEDEGVICGVDDCLCGRKGKYFKVTGRLKNAEIRGCSDTYAIPSALHSMKMHFAVGDNDLLEQMKSVCAFEPFSKTVVDFLDTFSKILLKSSAAKAYPDVVTLGFWCRKASVVSMQKAQDNTRFRLGRGIAFHIAPSNVAVNFAYSLIAALLAGNASIVRIPSRVFAQVAIICDALKIALDMNPVLKPYICCVTYDHNQTITDKLSSMCDVRIIWGGDETIQTIRKSPLKPRAKELTFADRFSICLIDSAKYCQMPEEHQDRTAKDFYNDTYLTDQNACTAPRIVVWFGERDEVLKAKALFWEKLFCLAKEKYILQGVQVVSKLASVCKIGEAFDGAALEKGPDNLIIRVGVPKLTEDLMDFKDSSGFFMEYHAADIKEIVPLCGRGCQTVSYLGMNPDGIIELLRSERPPGIDRIVSMGKTMDFSLVWDGYDLISEMSRVTTKS